MSERSSFELSEEGKKCSTTVTISQYLLQEKICKINLDSNYIFNLLLFFVLEFREMHKVSIMIYDCL